MISGRPTFRCDLFLPHYPLVFDGFFPFRGIDVARELPRAEQSVWEEATVVVFAVSDRHSVSDSLHGRILQSVMSLSRAKQPIFSASEFNSEVAAPLVKQQFNAGDLFVGHFWPGRIRLTST